MLLLTLKQKTMQTQMQSLLMGVRAAATLMSSSSAIADRQHVLNRICSVHTDCMYCSLSCTAIRQSHQLTSPLEADSRTPCKNRKLLGCWQGSHSSWLACSHMLTSCCCCSTSVQICLAIVIVAKSFSIGCTNIKNWLLD